MVNQVPVAKYILKKAVQLNQLEKKKQDLAKEITHWLKLSGVPYADLKPYNFVVKKLLEGEFESEEDILKALEDLLQDK
ncbi:hypothetical protein ABD87_14680 [Lysinibacillus sphaericus]|uniref:hypothetical protein n=1 Tax=Lysinibacillus sphaericus TaxID=1421 RepID=UPI0018CFC590|nr:hypothetical protein [Lysinibacillus sphaericus]MBG9730746.1 hypothetical protein [Lysinibacillus sphaericus]